VDKIGFEVLTGVSLRIQIFSDMICCVSWWVLSDTWNITLPSHSRVISPQNDRLCDSADEGNINLHHNVRHYWSCNTAAHPGRLKSSDILQSVPFYTAIIYL